MRYLIRLNSRAYNPITRQVIASRLWEIEQCENRDSEKVIWHAAAVRIDKQPVDQIAPLIAYQEFAKPLSNGEKRWQYEVWGICTRGQDNAIEIQVGARDASGN